MGRCRLERFAAKLEQVTVSSEEVTAEFQRVPGELKQIVVELEQVPARFERFAGELGAAPVAPDQVPVTLERLLVTLERLPIERDYALGGCNSPAWLGNRVADRCNRGTVEADLISVPLDGKAGAGGAYPGKPEALPGEPSAGPAGRFA